VYGSSSNSITKTGGTITGYDDDTDNGNVVKNASGVEQNNAGHAVYVSSSAAKRRETTAGPTVNLNSKIVGPAGGWAVPDITFTQLATNTWADGNLASWLSEQWFKFTATTATQYIHVSFRTLNILDVQVYDSGFNAVGGRTGLGNPTLYTSRTLTPGQEYYVQVTTPNSGTYKIAYNESPNAPAQ
jgi:hypothetical protein